MHSVHGPGATSDCFKAGIAGAAVEQRCPSISAKFGIKPLKMLCSFFFPGRFRFMGQYDPAALILPAFALHVEFISSHL